MPDVILPTFFKPKPSDYLIRLGNPDSDGGYLVDSRDVAKTDRLVCFGISDNWSFEEDFLNISNASLIAFDGSLSFSFWFKKFRRGVRALSFAKMFSFIRFWHFFSDEKRTFKPVFIGNDSGPKFISLKKSVSYLGETASQSIFFSIDIEGAEYELLDDIVAMSDKISGLVIEFHHIYKYIKEIEAFVNAFPLTLAHVHANNRGGVDKDNQPNIVELIFTSQSYSPKPVILPHPLDRPNVLFRKKKPLPELFVKFK